jgi:outer membrane protein OmpA-like peptidoglycan-associated protein
MGAYNKHRKARLKKESSHRNYKTLPPGTVTQASPRNRKDLRPPASQPPTQDTDEPVATIKKTPPTSPTIEKQSPTPNGEVPAKPATNPPPNSTRRKPFREMTQEQRRQTLKEQKPEVILPPIRFITAQDEFSVVNMDSFMEAMEHAKQGKVVLIEGHTDDIGSSDSNLKLSMKRAEKIRELMLSGGVSDDFISVIGFGEDRPLVPNSSSENRAVNRRIEFKVFNVPE